MINLVCELFTVLFFICFTYKLRNSNSMISNKKDKELFILIFDIIMIVAVKDIIALVIALIYVIYDGISTYRKNKAIDLKFETLAIEDNRIRPSNFLNDYVSVSLADTIEKAYLLTKYKSQYKLRYMFSDRNYKIIPILFNTDNELYIDFLEGKLRDFESQNYYLIPNTYNHFNTTEQLTEYIEDLQNGIF